MSHSYVLLIYTAGTDKSQEKNKKSHNGQKDFEIYRDFIWKVEEASCKGLRRRELVWNSAWKAHERDVLELNLNQVDLAARVIIW